MLHTMVGHNTYLGKCTVKIFINFHTADLEHNWHTIGEGRSFRKRIKSCWRSWEGSWMFPLKLYQLSEFFSLKCHFYLPFSRISLSHTQKENISLYTISFYQP